MFNRMRVLVPVFGLSLLALAAAACSDGKEGGLSGALDAAGIVESVHAAPERARDAGTAKMEMQIEVRIAGQKATGSSTGSIDFVNGAAKQKMKIQGLTMEMVMLDGVLYTKGPLSDEWTTLDVEQIQRLSGINPNNLNTNDPVAQMDALKDLKDVQFIGDEEVRGVSTKHFRGYSDLVEQSRQLAAGDPQAEKMAELVRSVVTDPLIPTDVWIDGEGRATKISFSVTYDFSDISEDYPELAASASLGEMTMKMQLEYFDWGIPVEIEAPEID